MNTKQWDGGVPTLEREIDQAIDVAFNGRVLLDPDETAYSKVYWIMAISPHWRYGVKEEGIGQGIRPLIDWRHTIHDEDSFEVLQGLARLVDHLSGLVSAEGCHSTQHARVLC
jgi:hypothetical protein